MDCYVDDLEHRLSGLTARFADLGPRLQDAARALQDAGAPVPDALVDELSDVRVRFFELRDEVLAATETMGVVAPAELESVPSLEPVVAALRAAREAERQREALQRMRESVLGTLERVLAVRHVEDERFAPLLGCHAMARELRDTVLALTESSAEMSTAAVTDGVRPFVDFLTILDGSEALDDDRFAELEESVSGRFGRALAVAAARGRLLQPGQVPVVAATPPLATGAPAPVTTPAPAEVEEQEASAGETPRPEEADLPTPPPAAALEAAAAPGEPDETAQWWLAAWARWSGWKNTLAFGDAVREELGKYPYLLAVPIQHSPEYDDGLVAYGYSILMEHIERQSPGCVGNALNSLRAGGAGAVGEQLYEYLVAEGRLTETYADFVQSVLLEALPEPGLWCDARIVHSRDDTRVFRRPTPRPGDTEQTAHRFLADHQRFVGHRFSVTVAPMTTRCIAVAAELKEAHRLEARLLQDGAPSEAAWVVTVPAAGKAAGRIEARRIDRDGSVVAALGRDHAAVWIAVYNDDPLREVTRDLVLTLRKDVRGIRR